MTQTVTTETTTKETYSITTPFDGVIAKIAQSVGRERAKEVERFIKFAIVGIIGAVVDFGTLNLLQASILPPVDHFGETIGIILPIGDGIFFPFNVALAATISFVAAILSNFTWNRLWTYPDSRSRSIQRQLALFAFISVIGWVARTIWISLSFHAIGNFAVSTIQAASPNFVGDAEFAARIGSNIALIIGIGVVMMWNFFANRYWTYNDVE